MATQKKSKTDTSKKKQKMRIRVKKAARRSGKISKIEGKVDNAKSKNNLIFHKNELLR